MNPEKIHLIADGEPIRAYLTLVKGGRETWCRQNDGTGYRISNRHFDLLKNAALSTDGVGPVDDEIVLDGACFYFLHQGPNGYAPMLCFFDAGTSHSFPANLLFKTFERLFAPKKLMETLVPRRWFTPSETRHLQHLKPRYCSNLDIGLEQWQPANHRHINAWRQQAAAPSQDPSTALSREKWCR